MYTNTHTHGCMRFVYAKRNGGKRKRGYTGTESFYGNGAKILLGENPLGRRVSREQTSRARAELSMQFSRGYSHDTSTEKEAEIEEEKE